MKNTWNIRDKHMTNTLAELLKHFEQIRAKDAYDSPEKKEMKAVVWAHNSHLGMVFFLLIYLSCRLFIYRGFRIY